MVDGALGGDALVFAEEPEEREATERRPPWRILIVDDDPSVHDVTRLALEDLVFDGQAVEFISAYTAAQARYLLEEEEAIAMILLDVVMESDDAGLSLVPYIRETLGDRLVRILLRTGQPGRAPERRVVAEHDISDYRTKSDLTAGKLHTAVISALRTYRHLGELDRLRREAEAISGSLARFFPSDVLRLLDKPSITELDLGDQLLQKMTVMFADIRGFTAIAARLTPAACFAFVNRVFGEIGPLIREGGGYIDKYLGDGFLALFPAGADDAVATAVAIQRRLSELSAADGSRIRLGVGLHTGEVMVGTVGERERIEVTALSDVVNVAARVEALTKEVGANVLLTEETCLDLSAGRWGMRSLGELPGVESRRVEVYELIDADEPETRRRKAANAEPFAAALRHFTAGEHAAAAQLLQEVLARDPDDEAARLYLRRAAESLLRLARREGVA
ncbi:MAG: hypothetical protein KC486_30330 [Myxococcales bacterium]|nr:hypothetical protein [Myxococcales bacterium]